MRKNSWKLIFLIPGLIFIPMFFDFIYLKGAVFSDLTISHYPNLVYLRRALLEFHVIPLWSPAILGGYPFFANPLSGLWYTPGWLAAAWPEPWAFNLLAAVHLVIGAVGMARLLELLGLRRESALFGGLAFGLMPKLLLHYAAGHITLLYAVVWTPWLLLAELRPVKGWIRPGLLLAWIFFADPRWAVYAGILWLGFSFAHSHGFSGHDSGESFPARLKFWARRVLPEGMLGLALAGPLLLPMIEYTRLSTRAGLTPEETLAFLLPPLRLFGLFFASPGAEWQLYPGAIILVLSFAGLLVPQVRKKALFWVVAAVASLLFAMGDEIPVLGLWAQLPLVNVFRVPARALFVFGFAIAVLAAMTLDALMNQAIQGKVLRRVRLLLAGFAAVWLSLWVVGKGVGVPAFGPLFGLLSVFLIALLIYKDNPFNKHPGRMIFLFLLMLSLDLSWVAYSQFQPRSKADVFSEGEEAARWISEQPIPDWRGFPLRPGQHDRFRVYAPTYSIPQHTAARYGLEMVNGVDPLQLKTFADYLIDASGIPSSGYSIALPPLLNGDETPVPDVDALTLLNVRYIVVDYALDNKEWELQKTFGTTRIYLNPWLGAPSFLELSETDFMLYGPGSVEWQPNRLDLHVEVPGNIMLLSEIDYPGWTVDAGEMLAPSKGVFRRVNVPDGITEISMSFRPMSLYVGIGLALLGFFGSFAMVRRENV